VTSIPKLRGQPKPTQPPTHRILDPEDVTTLAVLRGVIRAYSAWCRGQYEPADSHAHDDAVRFAAEAIGEPFFGMEAARLAESEPPVSRFSGTPAERRTVTSSPYLDDTRTGLGPRFAGLADRTDVASKDD
jgi:hypothetical protein